MKHAPFKARFRTAPVMPGLARLSGGSRLAAALLCGSLGWVGLKPQALADESARITLQKDSTLNAKATRALTPAERQALARLLAIENARNARSTYLVEALRTDSARVARQAALVMGRIASPLFESALVEALARPEASVRRTAAFALGLAGGGKGRDAIGAALASEADAAVRQALWQAFGRLASREQFRELVRGIETETDTRALEGAIEGLSQLWLRERTDWGPQPRVFEDLVKVASRGDLAAQMAAVTLARFRGERSAEQVDPLERLHRASSNETVRLFAVRSIGGVKSESAVAALERILARKAAATTRVEVAMAAGRQAWSPRVEALLRALLTDSNPHVVIQAAEATTTLAASAAPLAPVLESLVEASSRTAQERKNALLALAAVDPARGVARAKPLFEAARSAADKGFGKRDASDVALMLTSLDVVARLLETIEPDARPEEALFEMLLSGDARLAASAAEALASLAELESAAARLAADPAFVGHLAQALKAHDFRVACHLSAVVKAVPTVDLAGDLLLAWEAYQAPGENDGRQCLLDAMAALAPLEGAPKDALLARITSAVSDPVAPVAAFAALLVEQITGKPAKVNPRVYTKAMVATPSLEDVEKALATELTFVTSRGSISMRMSSAAPLTATNVVRLARSGFYDGLSFHRVVPNFVVQGGDPRGDGWGGPGYLIRDEVSLVSHAPGTVGIATSGKDTGGSQFFVNETHNFHLNGTYTVFARVTRGMEVVRRLTEGDRIEKVEVVTRTP